MALRLSRRKLAEHYANELLAGNKNVTSQLAAHLIETGRVRELELITRDIEDALARNGLVVASITSAHELTSETRRELMAYVKQATHASSVQLNESVQPELLGGVRISVPGAEMDASLQRKIMKLRAAKV